jgi:hypothetical protein
LRLGNESTFVFGARVSGYWNGGLSTDFDQNGLGNESTVALQAKDLGSGKGVLMEIDFDQIRLGHGLAASLFGARDSGHGKGVLAIDLAIRHFCYYFPQVL